MSEVIGVRFKKVGKVYYFDPCGTTVAKGQHVIVETARGVEYGETVIPNKQITDKEVVKPLKRLIRTATAADQETVEKNKDKAAEAFKICEKKIAAHNLDMKLVSVEYTFDRNKILFYFTADGRIDFRELVKDLASVFHTRIELRQIGVRDEAKMLGGLGICGRSLCCSRFLDDFQPVSINMAKEQNLSLNPTKISGTCGRLMCCLKYEQETYEALIRETPKADSLVETPDGPGIVVDSSLLKRTCRVKLGNEEDDIRTFPCQQCKLMRSARARVKSAPPAEEPPAAEAQAAPKKQPAARQARPGRHRRKRK